MAAQVWSGVSISVQSALAAAKTLTAITKANPGSVTSTAHGYANGDYVLLKIVGMTQLDYRVARVTNSLTNSFDLEGIDTTLYDTFTSGTAEKITFGTTLSTVADVNASGGDFNMIDVTTINDTVNKQIPGNANPVTINMTANWDPADAGVAALKTASDSKAQRCFMLQFATGVRSLFCGYVGATNFPTGSAQQKVTTPITVTTYGRPQAYSS